MLTATQIAAILMLLQAFGVDAGTVAKVGAILAPTPITNSQTIMTDQTQPPPLEAQSNPTPAAVPTASAPASQARVEIVSPIAIKGLNRQITTSPDFDENGQPRNELYVGAIVYDAQGQPSATEIVVLKLEGPGGRVTTTTLQGTGNVMAVYVDGQRKQVPYYPGSFAFTEAGAYAITFSSPDASGSVPVEVK